jgi:hypothetical protein
MGRSWAHYHLSCCGQHDRGCCNEAYQNKIVYYKESVECQHLIFWPGSWGGSTVMLQNWSWIRGIQSTKFPCKSNTENIQEIKTCSRKRVSYKKSQFCNTNNINITTVWNVQFKQNMQGLRRICVYGNNRIWRKTDFVLDYCCSVINRKPEEKETTWVTWCNRTGDYTELILEN